MWSETPLLSWSRTLSRDTRDNSLTLQHYMWVWCISVAVVMGYYGEVCDILIWSIVTMVTQWLVYV